MRATLATVIGCCLLAQACDTAHDNANQASEGDTTPVEVGLTVESPEAEDQQTTLSQPPETGEDQLTEAERIERKNQEMLAALAAQEQSSQTSETLPMADSDAEADKGTESGTESVSSEGEIESPQVDLSPYEERLSELVERYEEFRTRLRVAITDCEPKRTTSSGVIRDPYSADHVNTYGSSVTEGSAAACAEVRELNSKLSGVLYDYDRLYHDYTLEAMQRGMTLQVKRRQLPIPKRR